MKNMTITMGFGAGRLVRPGGGLRTVRGPAVWPYIPILHMLHCHGTGLSLVSRCVLFGMNFTCINMQDMYAHGCPSKVKYMYYILCCIL